MKTTTIENTDQIYNCSINASIRWRSIKFKEFQIFTHVVQGLIDSIGELDNDDDWFGLVKRIRGFRFNAIAAPLSEKLLQAQLRELIDWLHTNKIRFSYSHPNALEKYSQLLTMSEGLSKIKISQLLTALSNELSQLEYKNKTLVSVCEPRLVRDTERALSSVGFPHVEVASPTFLREDTTYKNIIVMGPTRWYPDYIFTAPKAENILVFKYEWIRDKWKHENVFTAPFKQRASKLMQTTINEPIDSLSLEPEMALLTAFDFKRFQKHVTDENRGHNEVDYVQARLFLLEEDWVVLLDANEASSVLVIDLSDSDSPVRKIMVAEIEPGMYVLLRTTGGGDFIVPVADRIMGESGIEARAYQRKWKSLLRSKVIRNGYEKVVAELRRYGSTRANTGNIRNWMFERSIKTEYRNDFDAIMRLVNLESESDTYWHLMEKIDHAHRQAGFKIRQMLLDRVKNSDLKVLKKTGKMDFKIEAENDISITAFQIKHISPEKIQVLPWQIGTPLKQSD